MSHNTLNRNGLPEHLRILADRYPRTGWETHGNFDDMTRFWLDRHLMFREVLSRLTLETRAHLDRETDAMEFARRTARLTSFFLNQLHGHHMIEDHHYFPLLTAQEPRLASGFTLLESDHLQLDENIDRLEKRTNHMLGRIRDGSADSGAGVVLDLLEDFDRFLHRHLTDEEELVVPIILEHGSVHV